MKNLVCAVMLVGISLRHDPGTEVYSCDFEPLSKFYYCQRKNIYMGLLFALKDETLNAHPRPLLCLFIVREMKIFVILLCHCPSVSLNSLIC